MNPIFRYSFPMLVVAPMAWADISLGKAPLDIPQPPAVYHTDLLAANAVHAIFREIRSIPVVSLDAAPSTQDVAVFEVKQNLAYRRYDRMGDGALQVGRRFAVTLGADIPGQDAALSDKIRAMKPGDEALLNIDHIYVFRESGNENVRACTRFAGIQPQKPTPIAEAPTTPPAEQTPAATAPSAAPTASAADIPTDEPDMAPQTLQPQTRNISRSVTSHITVVPDGKGGMRTMKVEVHREWAADGTQKVRKFINNVEVDPQTDKPLPIPADPDTATPAPQEPQPPAAPRQEPPAAAAPGIPEPAPVQEAGF